MPYKSNEELPSSVRGSLPGGAQSVFRNVVNSRLAAGQSDQSAFRQGWHAVRQGWDRTDQGVWTPKAKKLSDPSMGGELIGKEFDPNQPRDEDGKWTVAGRVGRIALGAAALGVGGALLLPRLGGVAGVTAAATAIGTRAAQSLGLAGKPVAVGPKAAPGSRAARAAAVAGSAQYRAAVRAHANAVKQRNKAFSLREKYSNLLFTARNPSDRKKYMDRLSRYDAEHDRLVGVVVNRKREVERLRAKAMKRAHSFGVAKGEPEFNPDQPRGEDGQWTGGGAGGGAAAKPKARKPRKPKGSDWGRYALTAGALIAAGVTGAALYRVMRTVQAAGRVTQVRTRPVPVPAGLKGTPKQRLASTLKSLEIQLIRAQKGSRDARDKLSTFQVRHGRIDMGGTSAAIKAQRKRLEEAYGIALSKETNLLTSIKETQQRLRSIKEPRRRLFGSKKRASFVKRHAPVYVCRYLVNMQDLVKWAKSQGFPTTIDPDDMHVTVVYSRQPMDWPEALDNRLVVRPSEKRTVEQLGDEGAVVLCFESNLLMKRWENLRLKGASHDYDSYKPHITITYRMPKGFDLSKVKPYTGELVFGPEDVRPLQKNPEQVEKLREITRTPTDPLTFDKALVHYQRPEPIYTCHLFKADEKNKKLGLIFGWAIISNEKGVPYYDTQGDHIPEESMLSAAAEFMQAKRQMKIMHSGRKVGTVVFAWPMTQDIAEAMGIKGERTGLMIAVKPDNPNIVERFKNKQYTGFSIGGNRLVDEEEDDDGRDLTTTKKSMAFIAVKDVYKYSPDRAVQ